MTGVKTCDTRAATIPCESTIAFKVALILFNNGPLSRRDLIARLDTHTKNGNIHTAIDRAIDYDWLAEDAKRLLIDVSDRARRYFNGDFLPEPEKYVGIPAAPRIIDRMNSPPISKKYLTNSRGSRDDIFKPSLRDHQSFKTRA